MLQKGTNEFLPASSKNLTKLLQKIDRFTVRLYIYTCTARSLILGLEMHICLLLQSSIWSKKCTRLQNRLAHIIYIYIYILKHIAKLFEMIAKNTTFRKL